MAGFFKDLLKMSGSNTLAALVNIIIGIVVTRQLGPEGRGIYAAILVVPMMVLKFTELGIRRSVIYHVGRKLHKEEEIIGSLSVTIIFTTVLGTAISFGLYWFLDNPAFTIPLMIIAISRIPLQLVRRYAGGYFMGKQRYDTSINIRWVFLSLYLLTTVVFLLVFKWGITGALLSIMVSNFIICLYIIHRILNEVPAIRGISMPVLKSLLRYGVVYSLSSVFMMLHVRIDVLILARLSTMEQLGYYSLAVAIATNWQIPFSVGGVIISKSAGSENIDIKNTNIAKLLRVAFLVGLLSYLVLFFLAPVLVRLLYGLEFIPGVILIRVLLPGILLLIVSNILSSRLAGDGKPHVFMFIAIPSLLINILLNYLWIPQYDALGAAYATDVSYAFQAIAGIIVYSSIVKMPVSKLFRFSKSDFDFIPALKELILTRKRRFSKYFKKQRGNRKNG